MPRLLVSVQPQTLASRAQRISSSLPFLVSPIRRATLLPPVRCGELIAVTLRFSEKFGMGTFLQDAILLMIGLKILSLKHKDEEYDSFSPTKSFSQRISHTHTKSSSPLMIMAKRYVALFRKQRAEDTKQVREDQICESLYFPREV